MPLVVHTKAVTALGWNPDMTSVDNCLRDRIPCPGEIVRYCAPAPFELCEIIGMVVSTKQILGGWQVLVLWCDAPSERDAYAAWANRVIALGTAHSP